MAVLRSVWFWVVLVLVVGVLGVTTAARMFAEPPRSLAGSPAPAEALPDPAMAGRWHQTGQRIDGRPMVGARIQGDTFVLTYPGENLAQSFETTFAITGGDASAQPMWLELTAVAAAPRENPAHNWVGQSMGFIYRIDGEQLTLATRGPGQDRPPSFDNQRAMVWQMQRAPEADQPGSAPLASGPGLSLAPALPGLWMAREDVSLIVQDQRLQVAFGPSDELLIELLIIGWDPDADPKRIETVIVRHPERGQLGKRARMIYQTRPDGSARTATYFDISPGYGRWPAGFRPRPGQGLVTMQWQRSEP